MERVEVKGLDEITSADKYQFNKIVNSYYDKMVRVLKNEVALKVSVKEYETPGKAEKVRKYSITADARTAAGKITADNADWDLNRALHGALKALLGVVEKKFRSSDQHDKVRKPQQSRK